MKIRKIYVENFKKYLNDKATFDFMNGVSPSDLILISGKNATGKSTIVDALFIAFTNKKTYENRTFEVTNDNNNNIVIEVEFQVESGIHTIKKVITKGIRGNSWTTFIDNIEVPDKKVMPTLTNLGLKGIDNFFICSHPLALINPDNSTKDGTLSLFFKLMNMAAKNDLDKIIDNLATATLNNEPLFSNEEITTLKAAPLEILNLINTIKADTKDTNTEFKAAATEYELVNKELTPKILSNDNLKVINVQLNNLNAYVKTQNEKLSQIKTLENNILNSQKQIETIKSATIPTYEKEINKLHTDLTLISNEEITKVNNEKIKAKEAEITKIKNEGQVVYAKKFTYVDKNASLKQQFINILINLATNNEPLITDKANFIKNNENALNAMNLLLDTTFGNDKQNQEMAFEKEKQQKLETFAAKIKVLENDIKLIKANTDKEFETKTQNIKVAIKVNENKIKDLNDQLSALSNSIANNETQLKTFDKNDIEKKIAESQQQILDLQTQISVSNEYSKRKEMAKQKYNELAMLNKQHTLNNNKLSYLETAKIQCLQAITDFVNAKTDRTEISLFNNANGLEKIDFQIKSKITHQTFYAMNSAERLFVGFELANLFQIFNDTYFPIVFDNVEAIDSETQNQIIKSFFKDTDTTRHQLFLLSVSNKPLNIQNVELNTIKDKLLK